MSDLIKTELPLTDGERAILKIIVSAIIPASEEFNLPGADDTEIFNRILSRGQKHEDLLRQGTKTIDEQSLERFESPLIESSSADQSVLIGELKSSNSPFVQVLVSITLQGYYQDPRVLESVEMEARPPFPQGYEVEQGDWTLLDPVRNREKFYRKV